MILPCSGATFSTPSKTESARRFAQDFYDWYARKASKRHARPAWVIAVEAKPRSFGGDLLRALTVDAAAQAKGEIVGLDFDPFLGSQDPAVHYNVEKVVRNGPSYVAKVFSVSAGKRSANPAVVAVIERRSGSWCFTNFRYPGDRNLIDVLRELTIDRLRPH